MKGKIKFLGIIFLVTAIAFLMTTCDNNGTTPEDTTTIPGSNVQLTMVRIDAGSFTMGTPAPDGMDRERPTRNVTVDGFYMGKYPVTQAQYEAVMRANPNTGNLNLVGANRPVVRVNWYHAIAFCNRLSILKGLTPVYSIVGMNNTNADAWLHSNVPTTNNVTWNNVTANWSANGYRLPTEAEWEFACRAGAVPPTLWNTGTSITTSQAKFNDDHSGGSTSDVGSYAPNAWGLYDMHGNVWEWCWDWFSETYYNEGVNGNPKGPTSGDRRVKRGGSWRNSDLVVRSAVRESDSPQYDSNHNGFRLVRQ